MGKFTNEERFKVKSIVATLTLKRMSDKEIIEIIFNQTNKMIFDRALYDRTVSKKIPINGIKLFVKDSMNTITSLTRE